MENNTNLTINSEELKAAFEGGEVKKPKTNQTPKESPKEKQGMTKKKLTVFLILGLVGLIGGGIMLAVAHEKR